MRFASLLSFWFSASGVLIRIRQAGFSQHKGRFVLLKALRKVEKSLQDNLLESMETDAAEEAELAQAKIWRLEQQVCTSH